MAEDIKVYDDVFEALGRPDATVMRTRVRLAAVLTEQIRSRGWKQNEAAERLKLSQPDLSRLMNGNVRRFSEAKLEELLVRMNLVVRIVVSAPTGGQQPGVLVESTI